mgnify:FL=1
MTTIIDISGVNNGRPSAPLFSLPSPSPARAFLDRRLNLLFVVVVVFLSFLIAARSSLPEHVDPR